MSRGHRWDEQVRERPAGPAPGRCPVPAERQCQDEQAGDRYDARQSLAPALSAGKPADDAAPLRSADPPRGSVVRRGPCSRTLSETRNRVEPRLRQERDVPLRATGIGPVPLGNAPMVAPAGRGIVPWTDIMLVMPILAGEECIVFGERADRSGHLVHTVRGSDDPRASADRERREETDPEYERRDEEWPTGRRRPVAHATSRCSPHDVPLSCTHELTERYFSQEPTRESCRDS